MPDTPPNTTGDPVAVRRRVLGGCGALFTAGLAGCLFADVPEGCDPDGPPSNGFELRNGDANEHSVTVDVVRDRLVSATTVFERTFDVGTTDHDRTVRVGDAVAFAGRYVVSVTLESDPPVASRHLWTVAPDRCDGLLIEIANGWIQVSEPDEREVA